MNKNLRRLLVLMMFCVVGGAVGYAQHINSDKVWLCDGVEGLECKYADASIELRKIYLIGVNLEDENSHVIRSKYIQQALEGEIILMMESETRGVNYEKKLTESMREMFKNNGVFLYKEPEDSLLFGMEGELSNVVVDLLFLLDKVYASVLNLQSSLGPDFPKEVALMKQLFIWRFMQREPFYMGLWKEFFKFENLSFVFVNDSVPYADAYKRLMSKLSVSIKRGMQEEDGASLMNTLNYSDIEWYSFVRKFMMFLLERRVKDSPEAEGLDYELLKNNLDNPNDRERIKYVRCKIGREWRDKYIAANTIDIFENKAKSLGRDVYIIVGNDHYDSVKKQFAERGYEVDISLHDEFYSEFSKLCEE